MRSTIFAYVLDCSLLGRQERASASRHVLQKCWPAAHLPCPALTPIRLQTAQIQRRLAENLSKAYYAACSTVNGLLTEARAQLREARALRQEHGLEVPEELEGPEEGPEEEGPPPLAPLDE